MQIYKRKKFEEGFPQTVCGLGGVFSRVGRIRTYTVAQGDAYTHHSSSERVYPIPPLLYDLLYP